MNFYVFTVQSQANALPPIVDAQQGYPKPGHDIGGGIHVPPPQSVTTTYAQVQQHPTLPQWAYLADPVTQAALAQPNAVTALSAAAVALPAPTALDASWTPAVAQVGTAQVTA